MNGRSNDNDINFRGLRLIALFCIGWTPAFTLLPDFFLSLLGYEFPLLSGVCWAIGIVLVAVFMSYVCIKIMNDFKISALVFSGVGLLFVSQTFRVIRSMGMLDDRAIPEWVDVVRAADNLLNGLGITLVALAFAYALIEMLYSRQQILKDHDRLASEIARRAKVEEELREHEALLRGISTSALDGIIVMDNEGRVTYWNPAAEKILGYNADEIIGQLLHKVLVPPNRRHEYNMGISEWQQTGKGPVVGKITVLKTMTKCGREIDAELSVSSMEIAGNWHAVGILRDVTQRKQAQEEYSTILQAAMDGFWIVDGTGKIVDVNDTYCSIIGYSREELLRMKVYDVEVIENSDDIISRIRTIHQKGHGRFETRHRRKDGKLIDIEVSVMGYGSSEGKRQYVFLRDITEKKRDEKERRDLEAQVQYTQKLESLGILAGGIAHDFNNILQIILGNVNLIQKVLSQLSPAYQFTDNIKRSVDRAVVLTRQMLAYSGSRSVALQAVNLNDVAGEMIHLLHVSISRKVTVQTNFMKGLPAIEGDPAQIQQVAMNLILNASESLDEGTGGVVTVSTMILHCTEEYLGRSHALYQAPEGNYVCLEVSDTGCGMSEDVLTKLFDPFFTTKFTGRGLGMSAVLGIMRGHKGAILVDSIPGKGTTIQVLFPMAGVSFTHAAQGEASIPLATPGRAHMVLFVDDEPDLLDLGVLALEQLGYTVLKATDGLEAVKIFESRAEHIDGVILDLSMPQMDGVETLKELRRIKPDIRVILASGYAEQDLQARFEDQNINAFLQKPYDMQVLSERLETILH